MRREEEGVERWQVHTASLTGEEAEETRARTGGGGIF